MCGIVGIVRFDGGQIDRAILKKMADTLYHRGPDEEGFYIAPKASPSDNGIDVKRNTTCASFSHPAVGFAHRRLSIIDISSGQQPLCNEDGTIWITFNGEIYNFLDLKRDLQSLGHVFRTNSDTETIVHAYEEWGTDCLSRLAGMFAFAVWDGRSDRLFIARDRIGKKPLYYHMGHDCFVFASELKAILRFPGISKRLNLTALVDYLKYLYIPDPKSIYEDIFKLPPAHYLMLENGQIRIGSYWDVSFIEGNTLGEDECAEQLLALLDQAVAGRMIAEVPLGAFLSGGVDSGGVVALMTRHSETPVITCSIGFDAPEHDETGMARVTAGLLRTDHREFFVRNDFVDLVRRLPALFDEPFADSSAVPTYYVCKMARQAVTVALSGDGGDESFGGYHKYMLSRYENMVRSIVPWPILATIKAFCLAESIPACRRARTLATAAMTDPARAFYVTNTFISDQLLNAMLTPVVKSAINGYDPFEYTAAYFNRSGTMDPLSRMLYTDLKTYLPGDILVKVDRMSMANSLEVRSPLLDHRVIEFAASIPADLKIRNREQKYILKKVFGRLLPGDVLDRPKHGFTVPIDHWFRNEMKLLSEEVFWTSTQLQDYINVNAVRTIWEQHQSGSYNWGTPLWSILMLGLWFEDQT